MIRNLVMKVAEEAGIELTKIDVIDGKDVGCLDAGLLRIYSDHHFVSEILYSSEMIGISNGLQNTAFELRILRALNHLKTSINTESS